MISATRSTLPELEVDVTTVGYGPVDQALASVLLRACSGRGERAER